MIKRLLVFLFIGLWLTGKSQCPQVYNYLGTLTLNPQFISCTGTSYAMNYQSNSSWGSYTINWGDGSPNTTGASYVANAIIPHTYAAVVNTFVLTLTLPSAACTMTSLVVLEKPVNASIQIPTLGITQACAPKTLTFTNSSTDVSATTSFTWNFGDGTAPVVFTFTNVGQSITHQYNKYTVNCQTQVTLLAKNYCSFSNPTIANFNPIQIYDVDSAIVTPDKVLRCWPDNIFTFSNTSMRNCLTQGNTFQRRERWNFGNYWGLNHDSIFDWSPWPPSGLKTIAYPSTGTYTVMLQDSNLCGVSSRVLFVSIVNSPTAGVVAPTGNLCQNTPLTFTNTSSPGYAYLWNFGTGGGYNNLGSGNKTNSFASAGTFTVKLVAQIPNAGGACSDTAQTSVVILAAPVASFSVNPSSGCNSINSATFTNSSIGASQWSWAFANGNTSTLQIPPTQNYTVTGLAIASLVVTGTTGCVHTATQALTVRSKPIPAFTQFTTCVNAPLTFTNNSTVSGTNAISNYTWNFGDGSALSNATVPVHTYSAPTNYTVKLKVATAFCIDSLSQTISINVKPTANFVLSPTVGCPPMASTFTNTSINATAYLWKYGTGPTATATAAAPGYTFTNNSQVFQNYTITLIASTGFGCSDSIKKTVSIRPRPIAGYSTNVSTGCSPLLTTFTDTSTGATTYSYSFGDGGSSTNPNPTHTYSNATLFTQTVSAQLTVTNSVGCRDTLKKVITIYPEALPIFTLVPASGCHPLTVGFTSIPGVVTYTWDHGDGSPTFTTLSAHNWTYANTGTTSISRTVSLIALTSNGCIGSDSKTVTIFPNPISDFSFNPSSGCSPLSVSYSNTSSGYVNSSWVFNNGQTSNINNPSTSFTNAIGGGPLTYSVKLKVTSVNGCSDSITKPITLKAIPKAAFTADTPVCAPKIVTFSNASTGANTFTWNFGNGATSTQSSAVYQFTNASAFNVSYTIKLVATNVELCKDSAFVQLLVHPKPQFFINASPDSGCSPLKVFFPKQNGVVKYQWKYDNITFGSAGDINNTFENKTSLQKIFHVQLIGSDANTCVDTADKNIKVYPKPTAKFIASPLTVYVPNQATQFTNQSTSAASYTWNFGDGGTSKEYNPTHTYVSTGEFQIQLVVTSNRGCRDTFLLPEKVVAIDETSVVFPNAFTPNPNGSPGTLYNPKDLSNDIFHPNIKGTEKYTMSIYSRWGELLFETKNPDEGWDGYYKGKLCTQDVYVWKVTATFVDGKTVSKTGDLLLLK